MTDNELLELCREVYEKTGWDDELLSHWQERVGGDGQTMLDVMSYEPGIAPLYTSDYLLEKLPPALWIEVSGENKQVALLTVNMQGNGEAIAVYALPYDKEFRGSYSSRADTPLKALLKLSIALHEDGELK